MVEKKKKTSRQGISLTTTYNTQANLPYNSQVNLLVTVQSSFIFRLDTNKQILYRNSHVQPIYKITTTSALLLVFTINSHKTVTRMLKN